MIESFLTVGRQIMTLYLLMAVGFVLGRAKLIGDRGSADMSTLVMYIVSPCMLLVAFQQPLEHTMLRDFAVMLGLALLLHLAFIVLSCLLIREKDAHRRGLLLFSSVFSNCGFMGYPLMTALFGSIGVFYGSAYVVVFTFLTWTYGIYALTGDRSLLRLRPLLLNPGVISIVLAMALYMLQIALPEVVMVPVSYLADLNTPLPMVVVGYQLSHADFRAALRGAGAWASLLLRLVLFPLLALGICLLLRVDGRLTVITVIAASAPPAALLSMFSAKFRLDTELASSLVSVQSALSALTMPLLVSLADYLA